MRVCLLVSLLLAAFLLVPSVLVAQEEASSPTLCETWESEYEGDAAVGEHVIALWPFSGAAATDDASGNGHDLVLNGGKIVEEGRFGACLESFPGWPVTDAVHRARAENHPALSPQGAFTLEMWIQPKPELDAEYGESFLLDKKYVSDDDYQLILGAADRYGARRLRAILGFGLDSSTFHSRPGPFEPGTWYHVAFTYDGDGTGSFFVNGLPLGTTLIGGRKSISPGKKFLSIGDRIGSYYHGFPGRIDQVRISSGVREFRRAKFEFVSDRTCFVRMEPNATLKFAVTNLFPEALTQGQVTIALPGAADWQSPVAELAPGETVAIDYPLNTGLRPDPYDLVARFSVEAPRSFTSEESFAIRIVPRRPPNRFPVLMWGGYGKAGEEIETLKRIGFTHVLGLGASMSKIFEAKEPTLASEPDKVAEVKRTLDKALAADLGIAASLSPGSAMRSREEFQRVDREGKPLAKEDVCGLFPEMQEFCYNVGASVAQTYGHFPAFEAAMIHTEVRGHARPCFHEHDLEAFREHAGIEIPAEPATQRGVDYTKLADFPESRVIPDDHPIYRYYRWYWKTGDGWNGLNSALDRGLKSTGRDDLWTYHDPAVRVAAVYGSGGDVDILSQWTYSYPDPIRIGLSTDELFAMVGGASTEQQVMKMTQIIWYRSQTAPEAKTPEEKLPYQARWEQEQPGAPFITIAPMHLREAFWTKMARPIRGIMYHGWQSLVHREPPRGYRFTHPQTERELSRLVRQVVRPLGPTLLQVPGVKSDVAFLESFASEMFAKRGTYGWNHTWAGDAYHVMLYAHLQPEIVFDETIQERGLDGFRVLVMPDCDVITQTMLERIEAFQKGGGLVVGDERLTPAITPDIRLTTYKRTGQADDDKAALQALAATLRQQLDARYSRYADSSNPNVIPYLRRFQETDYLFVVNDHREFGNYVGHHGRVMENGLPSDASLVVNRAGGSVYDLVGGRQVATANKDGKISFPARLGPCDGRVFMITPRPIDRVAMKTPETATRGESASFAIGVLDSEGQAIDAVVPLEVEIRDAEGRLAEFSGFYGAAGGLVEIRLDIASNDPPGIWQIHARELASNRTAVAYLRVP